MDTDREWLDALAKTPQGKAHMLLSVVGLAQECLVHRARLALAVTVDLDELTHAVDGVELVPLRAHLNALKAGLQEDGIIILTVKL